MQKKQNKTALVWFKNNLRIRDNASLHQATQDYQKVIAVYFFNPKDFAKTNYGFKKTEKFRAQFLIESVTNLKEQLAKLNITLLTFYCSPESKIHEICHQYYIDSIYTQKEWTSEEVLDNQLLLKKIPKEIRFIETYDQFLYNPTFVTNNFNNIPNVFTVFRKKAEKMVQVLPEKNSNKLSKENLLKVNTSIHNLKDLGFSNFTPHPNTAFNYKGGETSALKRLDYYLFESKKVGFYKKTRNGLIGKDYSTKFSPWLANGSLSAKTIYWKIKEYETIFGANQSTYWVIFELIWRDYFKYISLKYQNKIFKIGGILNKNYDWNINKEIIDKWVNGTTNDDFVNANMIELKETGWMSNRGRQNVASYFAKNLLQDWRIGASYFESLLLDYDVHSNYGNWMYVAGVGNDPRDRKFNTQLQADRYDANYKYRKLWLTNTLF